MFLEIITPDQKVYSGEARLVKIPGSAGVFELLDNHAPIISSMNEGQVKVITPQDQSLFFDITGGIVQFSSNKAAVLADAVTSK